MRSSKEHGFLSMETKAVNLIKMYHIFLNISHFLIQSIRLHQINQSIKIKMSQLSHEVVKLKS